MTKKLIIIFLCIAIIAITIPKQADAFNLIKLVGIIKKIIGYINSVRSSLAVLAYIPHNFPFGGHIISSERACSLKFRVYTGICYGPFGCWLTGPFPGYIPFGGRAISVGPPVPSPGKMIIFPWVSDVYRNHSEDRVGPWALGLGFTPFPLKEINDALDALVITNNPQYLATGCVPLTPATFGIFCLDNFHFDCQASGEKDKLGNDIYMVIRKLGTSP